jgi:hypothetical protein
VLSRPAFHTHQLGDKLEFKGEEVSRTTTTKSRSKVQRRRFHYCLTVFTQFVFCDVYDMWAIEPVL